MKKYDEKENLKDESKIATTIRIPLELLEKLKKEAQNLGISFNAYIIYLLNQHHQMELR